jgi:hypothetical protein
MANRLVSLVVLVLATSAWVALRRQMQRTAAHDPTKVKTVPVQTWEGEGGALPVTGAQLGPDPAVKPESSPHQAEPLPVPTPLGP